MPLSDVERISYRNKAACYRVLSSAAIIRALLIEGCWEHPSPNTEKEVFMSSAKLTVTKIELINWLVETVGLSGPEPGPLRRLEAAHTAAMRVMRG